jgi:hypothetical protein
VRVPRKLVLLLLLFLISGYAGSQNPAAATMATIINNLQHGGMNWSKFYPGIYGVIYAQTNGTGVYPQLAQLGPILNVVQLSGFQLPQGYFYYFRSFFGAGSVDWQIAADYGGNVLQLAFEPSGQSYQPSALPASTQPPAAPDPTPAPVKTGGARPVSPTTKDEACKLYPTLC